MTDLPKTDESWDAEYFAAEAETLRQLGDIEKVVGPTSAVVGIRTAVTTDMRAAYNEKTAAIRADRDAKAAQIVELKAALAKKD